MVTKRDFKFKMMKVMKFLMMFPLRRCCLCLCVKMLKSYNYTCNSKHNPFNFLMLKCYSVKPNDRRPLTTMYFNNYNDENNMRNNVVFLVNKDVNYG